VEVVAVVGEVGAGPPVHEQHLMAIGERRPLDLVLVEVEPRYSLGDPIE
jgi:hypothetical protein